MKKRFSATHLSRRMFNLRKTAYQIAGFHAWNMSGGKRAARENVTIVMLHGVHDSEMGRLRKAPANSMPLEGLIAGLARLRRRYSIVSLDSAVRMVNGERSLKPQSLVITFDDSLKCLAKVAAPVLAEAGIPATFYFSTEVIDSQRCMFRYGEVGTAHAAGSGLTYPRDRHRGSPPLR